MFIPYLQQNFLKYHKGNGYICSHVEALHATAPKADKYTDTIAEGIIGRIGCAGIISTVSRVECDLNRMPNQKNKKGVLEYRKAVRDIIDFLKIINPSSQKITTPYLNLSFHGMKDSHHGPLAIEIGTLLGKSCSPEIKKWLTTRIRDKLHSFSPDINVVIDRKFKGNKSILSHRFGDFTGFSGYGTHFHTLQIELSRTIRKKKQQWLVAVFSELITEFQENFVEYQSN